MTLKAAPGDVEPLPPLYARWTEALLGAPIPRERRATCDSCAMCQPSGEAARPGDHYFAPDTKCCTYTPSLPNFLAGRILADDDPAMAGGRASVSRRIDGRAGVTPLGLDRSPIAAALYAVPDSFGRSRALICPHFVDEGGGRCGIWRHREAVCTTWFCKHVRGETGQDFWRETLLRLLTHLQQTLAKFCLLELDIGPDALAALAQDQAWVGAGAPPMRDRRDPATDDAAYARLWGEWAGRERQFFVRCGERVDSLGWDAVMALGGPEAQALALLTRRAFERMTTDDAPPALCVGHVEIARADLETTRLVTYSPLDPLDVPSALVALLPFFDGRPTVEAVALVAKRTGVQLAPDLVRKLADFGVLKAAESPS